MLLHLVLLPHMNTFIISLVAAPGSTVMMLVNTSVVCSETQKHSCTGELQGEYFVAHIAHIKFHICKCGMFQGNE